MMKESESSDLKTDILLITVTTVEAQAVLHLFAKETGGAFQRRFIGDKTYFDLGEIHGARVMLAQSEMGTRGPGGALLVVDEGIRILAPSAVIMVGGAFGLDSRNREIGDILVSQQLLGYELQEIATGEKGQAEILLLDDRPRASTRLLDRFRGGALDWQGPKVEFGLILSGDKLVDSQGFLDQLRKLAPEALGGEMEGTGLYAAAQRRKVDWIIIKAICDWANGDKGQDKIARQEVAAKNATLFTLHVLKQGGFVGEAARVPPPPLEPNTGSPLPSPERGTLLRRHDVHSSWVLAAPWEPDGARIASAGGDGTVRIWDAETGEAFLTYRGHTRLLNKINFQATIYAVAWAPEGLRIASAGGGAHVQVWNAATGQKLALYQGHTGVSSMVCALAWSPDGKQIVSACSSIGFDKTIHVWDAFTGQTLKRYDAGYGLLPNFSVLSIAWSADGKYIAAACGDQTIRIWNTATENLVSTLPVRSGGSSCIAWSPDSRYLASAHPDRTVQIWDMSTKTKRLTYREHTDAVRCVAWSPDGVSIATASNDRTAHIWQALSGTHLYTYCGHSDWVTSVSWSADGTRIASASNDRTVHIWYAGNNRLVIEPQVGEMV